MLVGKLGLLFLAVFEIREDAFGGEKECRPVPRLRGHFRLSLCVFVVTASGVTGNRAEPVNQFQLWPFDVEQPSTEVFRIAPALHLPIGPAAKFM